MHEIRQYMSKETKERLTKSTCNSPMVTMNQPCWKTSNYLLENLCSSITNQDRQLWRWIQSSIKTHDDWSYPCILTMYSTQHKLVDFGENWLLKVVYLLVGLAHGTMEMKSEVMKEKELMELEAMVKESVGGGKEGGKNLKKKKLIIMRVPPVFHLT